MPSVFLLATDFISGFLPEWGFTAIVLAIIGMIGLWYIFKMFVGDF